VLKDSKSLASNGVVVEVGRGTVALDGVGPVLAP
jgi:hypothetical protein